MEVGKLRLKTLDLLRNRPVHCKLVDIFQRTGLPVAWLKSFAQRGEHFDSGSDRIVALYEELSGRKLDI